jgi:flavorubredoxin
VATEILGAGALLVGSPTMNNQIFPAVADAMTYLEGLKPRGLVGAAFGSYGWSGEAVAHLEERLKRMKVELVADGMKIKYVPTGEQLETCRNLGLAVAEKLPR